MKNKLPEITLLFWIMKITATTLGDVLTKAKVKGGLDFGTIGSSLILGLILGILILYTTLNRNKGAELAVSKVG